MGDTLMKKRPASKISDSTIPMVVMIATAEQAIMSILTTCSTPARARRSGLIRLRA